MDFSRALERAHRAISGLPHNTVIKCARKIAGRVLRFRPRTRAILVFTGSVFIIASWELPWYDNLYWLNSGQAEGAALGAGYQVTNLSSGDPLAKYGLNPVTNQYSGASLASGSPLMRSLGLSRADFYWWLVLAALSLLAVWTYQWRGTSRFRDTASRVVDLAKAVSLVVVVAACVWKAGSLTSVTRVQDAARASLLSDFRAHGVAAAALAHIHTGLSAGFVSLFLGLVFAFLGVFSTTRKPKGAAPEITPPELAGAGAAPEGAAVKIRVSAGFLAFAALVYLGISIALFT
jgi:hypothetical protein